MSSLIDSIASLTGKTLADMQLPVKPDSIDGTREYRSIEVHEFGLRDQDDRPYIPYILLQPLNGKDSRNKTTRAKESSANVRFVITTYSENERDGMLTLTNIINRLRVALEQAEVIDGKYQLDELEWLTIPDNTEKYYLAEIMTKWSIPAIERRVPELHW